MRVETLGFDEAFAVQPETALSGMLCRLLVNALLGSRRSGKEEELAVSQNTINIKQQEFDFFCARLAVWHVADFSRAPRTGAARQAYRKRLKLQARVPIGLK